MLLNTYIEAQTTYFPVAQEELVYLVYRNTVQNVGQQSILFMYDNKSYLFTILHIRVLHREE